MPTRRLAALVTVLALTVSGCAGSATSRATRPSPAAAPPSTSQRPSAAAHGASSASTARRWQHVVVVVEENRDSSHIIGNRSAPYLNSLARAGLQLTDMHGETHPSQPNYLALLSGSTQGLTGDSCPHGYSADNLAHQLLARHLGFAAYAESLPRTGWTGCASGAYVRRHAPWTDFRDVPSSVAHPMTALPHAWSDLPAVSFVVPDLDHDMHDGSIAAGDAWLHAHLGGYATWARTHHSLLLVTWDEDENTAANHIATLAVGQGIVAGSRWSARADHYSLLASLQDAFGLPRLGHARAARAVPALR